MTRPALGANTSVCPGCGAGLRCGMAAGDAGCWCARLPPVMPVPALPAEALAAACFCQACLNKAIDERNSAVSVSAPEPTANAALQALPTAPD
ncbi:MAG: hypothetical protein JWR68_1689 [Polaromonas sp.]|nr:hypothetical protein [Polaromonas sp.]